jgi:hypothetical protein
MVEARQVYLWKVEVIKVMRGYAGNLPVCEVMLFGGYVRLIGAGTKRSEFVNGKNRFYLVR